MTRIRINLHTQVNWPALAAILATAAMWYGILWTVMAAF